MRKFILTLTFIASIGLANGQHIIKRGAPSLVSAGVGANLTYGEGTKPTLGTAAGMSFMIQSIPGVWLKGNATFIECYNTGIEFPKSVPSTASNQNMLFDGGFVFGLAGNCFLESTIGVAIQDKDKTAGFFGVGGGITLYEEWNTLVLLEGKAILSDADFLLGYQGGKPDMSYIVQVKFGTIINKWGMK